jgi:hypothetical protein
MARVSCILGDFRPDKPCKPFSRPAIRSRKRRSLNRCIVVRREASRHQGLLFAHPSPYTVQLQMQLMRQQIPSPKPLFYNAASIRRARRPWRSCHVCMTGTAYLHDSSGRWRSACGGGRLADNVRRVIISDEFVGQATISPGTACDPARLARISHHKGHKGHEGFQR